MKSLEIKKLSPVSVLKTFMYLMLLPSAIFIVVGVIMFLVGIFTKNTELAIIAAVIAILYPVILIGVYGGLAALQALIYNLCARKFGGLKLFVDENTEENIIS
jgi:hypothetical protein